MHTVKITIESIPSKGAGIYRATLRQHQSIISGRLKHRTETFSTPDVAALQRSYRQQLDLLHELAASGMPAPPPDIRELLELGRHITDLLPPAVREELAAAVQRARRHNRRLQIIFEVAAEAIDLLTMPWELMVLPSSRDVFATPVGESFLLLDTNVALIRQVRGLGNERSLPLSRPLVLQTFAAAPVDGRPIELDAMRGVLAQVFSPDQATCSWYQGAGTLDVLEERLRETRPQIVHLLCHGEQHMTGRGIRNDLIFTRPDGLTQRVSALELGPLLTLTPNLRLVVLQACYSGSIGHTSERERQAVAGVALSLVSQGVPAVVAMQGEIGQAAAMTFIETFYGALAQGDSLEQAVAVGRIAVWNDGSRVDWSLPVLYQGSSRPEPVHWSLRLEYRFKALLQEAWTRRMICSDVVAFAMVSLAVKVFGWGLAPHSALAPDDLLLPLAIWLGAGLIGPLIAAAPSHSAARRGQLPDDLRGAVMRASLMGAYLGYIIGGVLGLQLLASLWMIGLVDLLQPGALGLFAGMLLGSLGMSFAGARSQACAARTVASLVPELFDIGTLRLVLVASCICLAAPFATLALLHLPAAVLNNPALNTVAIALMLMIMAFRIGE